MRKGLIKVALLSLFMFLISGCKDDCAKHSSPSLNLLLKDALTQEVIKNGYVEVYSRGAQTYVHIADFVGDNPDRSDMLANHYFVKIDRSEDASELAFLVYAEGYYDYGFDTEVFIVDRSCGAKNDFVFEVLMCPYNPDDHEDSTAKCYGDR